ncbi:hypothetical protein AWB71_02562 [Caballeronia peredens]|nr:hypothetical protein AWB71_02562 [Caballeronia peredens]
MKQTIWHEINETETSLPKPNPDKTDSETYILVNLRGPGREGFIHFASDRLKNDPTFAKEALNSNNLLPFSAFSESVRNNPEVVKHAVSINAEHMRDAGALAKSNLAVVKAFMQTKAMPEGTTQRFLSRPTDYISPQIASVMFKSVFDDETGTMKRVFQKTDTKKLFTEPTEEVAQRRKLKM